MVESKILVVSLSALIKPGGLQRERLKKDHYTDLPIIQAPVGPTYEPGNAFSATVATQMSISSTPKYNFFIMSTDLGSTNT